MHPDRLRLLASALAGRTLDVAAADGDQLAWTDGATVFVDPDAPHARQVEMVCVQASLVAAGSLAPDLARQLVRRPGLTQRYLAIEGHRALLANEAVLPPPALRLLDREVAAGLASPHASLDRARRRDSISQAPPAFGTIDVRRVLSAADRVLPGTADPVGQHSQNAANSAVEVAALPDDADDSDDIGHLLSSPVGGGGAAGRLFRRLLSPARARGEGGPVGADTPTHLSPAQPRAGRRATVSTTPTGSPEDAGGGVPSGFSYPEWDVHRRRYRPDWCTVVETDPPVTDGVALGLPDGAALRRPLARLGIGLARCRRQRQGDDIDIDAAVEARVDALAGSAHGEEDFYIASLRRRRDLAVLVLLDVSGSAGEPGVAGKSVHEHQRDAAAVLAAALHELGDRVAVHAFNSRGRHAVQLQRLKSFDDRLDGAFARRLGSVMPGAYTRLGAAIRHGTTILEERAGTPRRLLVVISDGFAYDHGYEGRYGEADARRALLDARRRGVGCLCLSVGADADPVALTRVFGTAAHATVPRASELPRVIGTLFRAALRSAEAQRRRYQRTERTRERLEIERRADASSGATVLRAGR